MVGSEEIDKLIIQFQELQKETFIRVEAHTADDAIAEATEAEPLLEQTQPTDSKPRIKKKSEEEEQ